jgi:thiol-disulfide isomerase/thioredoxin
VTRNCTAQRVGPGNPVSLRSVLASSSSPVERTGEKHSRSGHRNGEAGSPCSCSNPLSIVVTASTESTGDKLNSELSKSELKTGKITLVGFAFLRRWVQTHCVRCKQSDIQILILASDKLHVVLKEAASNLETKDTNIAVASHKYNSTSSLSLLQHKNITDNHN